MRIARALSRLAGLCLCLLAPSLASAEGYSGHPAAQALIEEMVRTEGFDRAELEALFAGAVRKDSILEAIARPAEKTKPWHEYRDIFVTETRTQQGLEFAQRHQDSLQRAERQFGVPAELIVAIIGVETRYGRNKGSYRVIDALSTLAEELKGSYAGAMGFGQFIPTSYRAYAVDFDDDGVVDIINNPVDAIGSVANYFKRHRWRSGLPVTAPATVGEGYRSDWMNDGLKPKRSLAVLATGGIFPTVEMAPDTPATAMRFDGKAGDEYWLGWHNFYVITRYNHSAMYAMAVYQLSEAIRERL